MAVDTTLVIAIVGATLLTLGVLGAVALWLWNLSNTNNETTNHQDLERELIEEDNARPEKKERLKLEKQLEALLAETQQRHLENKEDQKALAERYEARYYEHVTLNGQDPDTLDMPLEQRLMRKEIKELQELLEEKEQERKEARKIRDKEDKEERARLAKSSVQGIKLDGYFDDDGLEDEQQNFPSHNNEYHFLNDNDAMKFNAPARSLRHKEDMLMLHKEHDILLHKEKFRKLDIDHSGFIDKDEMRRRMEAAVGEPVTDAEVDRVFRSIDADGNGLIDIQEFLSYLASNVNVDHGTWWGDANEEHSEVMSSASVVEASQRPRTRFAGHGDTDTKKQAKSTKPPKPLYSVQSKYHPTQTLNSEVVRDYVLNKDGHDKRYLV